MFRLTALAFAFFLPACSPTEAEVRFKVEMTISDNGQIKRESAVWSKTSFYPVLSTASHGTYADVEAIPFRLRDGNWLFLVPSESEVIWPELYYRRAFNVQEEDRVKLVHEVGQKTGWRFSVKCSYDDDVIVSSGLRNRCPQAVITPNLKDWRAFRNIDLSVYPQDDGRRLKIESIVITITDEKPTDRLGSMIPWLAALHRGEIVQSVERPGTGGLDALPPLGALKRKS